MLKDVLDEQVRGYREKQRSTEAERDAKKEKIVRKDANRVWEMLKKVFISQCDGESTLQVILGICDNQKNFKNNGEVYFRVVEDNELDTELYYILVFRKVKYIDETMEAICNMAKKEGLTYEEDSADKELRTAAPSLNPVSIYAHWIKFTYTPPKSI